MLGLVDRNRLKPMRLNWLYRSFSSSFAFTSNVTVSTVPLKVILLPTKLVISILTETFGMKDAGQMADSPH